MMTTYKLATLRDVFDKVPPDKVRLCLREMADAMEQAHALRDLIVGSAEELGGNAGVFWPDECEWIDDGKEDKTIKIVNDTTGQLELTYTSSKQATTNEGWSLAEQRTRGPPCATLGYGKNYPQSLRPTAKALDRSRRGRS